MTTFELEATVTVLMAIAAVDLEAARQEAEAAIDTALLHITVNGNERILPVNQERDLLLIDSYPTRRP